MSFLPPIWLPDWMWTFVRSAGVQLRSLFLLILIMVVIERLVFPDNANSVSSILNGLVSLPAAITVVYVRRRRGSASLLVVLLSFALLLLLKLAGIDEHEGLYDVVILSFFLIAMWLCVPYVKDWRFRRLIRRDSSQVAVLIGPASSRSTAIPIGPRLSSWGNVLLSVQSLLVVALALGIALSSFPHNNESSTSRSAAEFLDALIGGAAIWFLGAEMATNIAGFAAALLWMLATTRIEYAIFSGSEVVPTALVPLAAAGAYCLVKFARFSAPGVGVIATCALMVASFRWPLLAVMAAIATVIVLYALNQVLAARWCALPVLVCCLFVCFAFTQRSESIISLGEQTAVISPSHSLAACSSGCDGALPWEFLYPSPFGSAFASLVSDLFVSTSHWGNYEIFAISPGWAQLILASIGLIELWRLRQTRVITSAICAMVTGTLMSLPSSYLGVQLPSLTAAIDYFVPSFQFGAQFALVAALFICLLGGMGISKLFKRRGTTLGVVFMVGIVFLFAADTIRIPQLGHPAATLGFLSPTLTNGGTGEKPLVAFYPMITPDFGSEYDAILHVAQRRNLRLLNSLPIAASLTDLSLPDIFGRLQRLGVQYVVVSLPDYPRQGQILRAGHVLLPNDNEWEGDGWSAPAPAVLLGAAVIRSEGNGTFVIRL